MRTSLKEVRLLIKTLNEATGNPVDPWVRTEKKFEAQIGNYHIDAAYGGFSLYQMSDKGGGCRDVSTRGTKKELATFIRAMLKGIDAIKKV